MSRRSYASAVDSVLAPLGFARDGRRWTRLRGDVEEMVDLQVSQFAGTTANLYTKNLATEALLREAIPWMRPMGIVQEGLRIGQLIDGTDRWWLRDPNGPTELSEAIRKHAPPYFDSLLELEAQALRYGRGNPKVGNAAERIYLALTLHRMGKTEEACAALRDPPRRLMESWRAQVDSVRQFLGCPDPR